MNKRISGSFRLRLMVLVMLGVLPPLWGTIWYASHRAANLFRAEAQESLAIQTSALGEKINQWHQQNSQVLDKLRTDAEFASMERSQQLPTTNPGSVKAEGTEEESGSDAERRSSRKKARVRKKKNI